MEAIFRILTLVTVGRLCTGKLVTKRSTGSGSFILLEGKFGNGEDPDHRSLLERIFPTREKVIIVERPAPRNNMPPFFINDALNNMIMPPPLPINFNSPIQNMPLSPAQSGQFSGPVPNHLITPTWNSQTPPMRHQQPLLMQPFPINPIPTTSSFNFAPMDSINWTTQLVTKSMTEHPLNTIDPMYQNPPLAKANPLKYPKKMKERVGGSIGGLAIHIGMPNDFEQVQTISKGMKDSDMYKMFDVFPSPMQLPEDGGCSCTFELGPILPNGEIHPSAIQKQKRCVKRCASNQRRYHWG